MNIGRRNLIRAGLLAVCGLAIEAAPASAHCLASRRPIEGRLGLMRVPTSNGHAVRGYQINLDYPSCADTADADGAPVRLYEVRSVQILPSSGTGVHKLESLLGQTIQVAGFIDSGVVPGHSGIAVLANAWLIAVPALGQGRPVTPDNGRPDVGEGYGKDEGPSGPAPDPDADARQASLSHTDIAITGPDGTATPYVPPPDDAGQTDIEARLAKFVTAYYLTGQNIGPDVLRGIYASKVDYFGKSTSIDDVVKAKVTFYSRWPVREFTLQPGTLAIRPLPDQTRVYELTFNYDFKVTSVDKVSHGRGYARLQIDLAEGHGKIIKESGKVIAHD